jgi:hypothetical protein
MYLISVLCRVFLLGIFFYVMFLVNDFYSIYNSVVIRQRDSQWLYDQCLQPDFATKLGYHSDACEQVKLVFLRTPFQLAADSLWQQLSVPLTNHLGQSLCLCLMPVAVFMILIPPYLSYMEKRERERLSFAAFCSSLQHQPSSSSHKPTPYTPPLSMRWRKRANLKDYGKV